ncbi:SpoVR family protein [Roseomonas marmotae]|uniref:SpoVR family protein n=1 Tax=Roseomonas marmotae TaxID=2768161 RepID=A0ABS3K7B1_9PROT|nr:SpoVR family protein [Roseomonas marmotae]MBO1073342.1 SpoVR family protein [Roseomonas marmotae]QTI79044.1 SpoVR family protein [Roseomonas marmotae]
MSLLYKGADWDFGTLKTVHDAIEDIALNELGLDVYPNQIEVITSEQMLERYSSTGLPLMYSHWSFGKHFARDHALYRAGAQGLAYEIVINSSPCISYIMEENTMTMQALVVAHAAFGHNHFFKNNHMFQQWTDAEGILEYLEFATAYVAKCEARYGLPAVERILDAAHALQSQGVNRYRRRVKQLREEQRRAEARREYEETTYNPLWSTVPGVDVLDSMNMDERARAAAEMRARLNLPEENLLYFIEKNAPALRGWERELIRIVRTIGQYFYPQKQTKVMNEGCATFTHYEIMQRMHDRGQISDGNFQEFLHSHTAVIFQPGWDDPRFSGWNPYALGFAMMNDIKRICTEPTSEDRYWFPEIAGNGDPYGTLRSIWATHRDESFVLQYLSPKVIRDFRMFHVSATAGEGHAEVRSIHNEDGYRAVRRELSRSYDLSVHEPDINVVDVELLGDRRLILSHAVYDGRLLESGSASACLSYIRDLWGYPVRLQEHDASTDRLLNTVELK